MSTVPTATPPSIIAQPPPPPPHPGFIPPPGFIPVPEMEPRQSTTPEEAAYQHLLQDVLGFAPSSPPMFALAMEGITTVEDLVTLEEDFFPHLVYFPRDHEPAVYIPRGNAVQLQVLVRHACKPVQDNGGVPLAFGQRLGISTDQFNSYCFSFPVQSSSLPRASQHLARPFNRVNDFKKAIKR